MTACALLGVSRQLDPATSHSLGPSGTTDPYTKSNVGSGFRSVETNADFTGHGIPLAPTNPPIPWP